MRIELENARIASTATAASKPERRIHRMPNEELTFVFEKITVTWLNGGIVGTGLEQ